MLRRVALLGAPHGTARLASSFVTRLCDEVQQDSGRSGKSPCESQAAVRSAHAHTSVQSLLRADLKDWDALAAAPIPELPPASVVDGSVALHRACKRAEPRQFP